MIQGWRNLRIADRISNLLLLAALVFMVAVFASAQQPSQDLFNGRIDATLVAQDKRIERLETELNYAVVTLIANLCAHLVQISTQLRRRREHDDEPRVIER